MSLVVLCEGRVIWSPALRVGRLFADELGALESLVGVPSGFAVTSADEVHVDRERFVEFVAALTDAIEQTNNPVLTALVSGPLEVAVALRHAILNDEVMRP